jgi:hypothetical protein
MAIDDEDLFETVVCDAFCDIHTIVNEMIRLDSDRSREVNVVPVEAIRHQGHDQYLPGDSLSRGSAYMGNQEVVSLQEEVVPMILNRPYRQEHHPLLGYRLFHFRPRQLPIHVLRPSCMMDHFRSLSSRPCVLVIR